MKHSMLIICTSILIVLNSSLVYAGDEVMNKNTMSNVNWQGINRDEKSIYLYKYPEVEFKRILFALENKEKQRISNMRLSPNATVVVFRVDKLNSPDPFDIIESNFYAISVDSNKMTPLKIKITPNHKMSINHFLGENIIVFEDYEYEENGRQFFDYLTQRLLAYDLVTNEISVLEIDKPSKGPKGISSVDSSGEKIVIGENNKIFIFNRLNSKIEEVKSNHNFPIISPNGQMLLLQTNERPSEIVIYDLDTGLEQILFSKKQMKQLISKFKGFVSLRFVSWSPDSKRLLFYEVNDAKKEGDFFLIEIKERSIKKIKRSGRRGDKLYNLSRTKSPR